MAAHPNPDIPELDLPVLPDHDDIHFHGRIPDGQPPLVTVETADGRVLGRLRAPHPGGFDWTSPGRATAETARRILLAALPDPRCPACEGTRKVTHDENAPDTPRAFRPDRDDPHADTVYTCHVCADGYVEVPHHMFRLTVALAWQAGEWRIGRPAIRAWIDAQAARRTPRFTAANARVLPYPVLPGRDDLVFHGVALGNGETVVLVEEPDGRIVGSVLHVVRHSPTGLAWGYTGSGAADTARCVLLAALPDALCGRCGATGRIVLDDEDTDGTRPFDPRRDDAEAAIGCPDCDGDLMAAVPYQDFKFAVVAGWDEREWRMTRAEILTWLIGHADVDPLVRATAAAALRPTGPDATNGADEPGHR